MADGRGRKTAAQINRDFLDWLAEKEDERPFFVFLNYFDAPRPISCPKAAIAALRLRCHYLGGPCSLAGLGKRRTKQGVSESEVALVSDAYDDCIAYLDAQIGKLIDELDGRGLLKDTLVVITSDHGEELGEHELYGHGRSLYGQEVHVPLVIVAPGRSTAGRVIGTPVSLRDLPATFVDLLGCAHDSPFPGKSLARYWESGRGGASAHVRHPPIPKSHFATRCRITPIVLRPGGARCSRSSPMAGPIFAMPTAAQEIYDIENDPAEVHNLAGPARSQTMLKLRQVVQSVLDETRP